MPSKKSVKSSGSRTRSKSAGRVSRKSRTPTRSRSRSRARTPVTKVRKIASETKARPQSSSSSSSRDASPAVLRPRKQKKIEDGTKRRQTLAAQAKELKFELLRNIEASMSTNDPVASNTRNRSLLPKPSCICRIDGFIRRNICESRLIQLIFFLALVPLVYWSNLMVFAPQTGASTSTIWWGPAKPFAKVLWPIDWKVYFNGPAFLAVFVFMLLHLFIARCIPIGPLNDKHPRYRSNGFITLILLVGLLSAAQWSSCWCFQNIRPGTILPKHLLGLITAATTYTFILAFAHYFISRRASASQLAPKVPRQGNFIHDFFNGRLLRPSLFGVDWKLLAVRVGITAMLVVNSLYLAASYSRFGKASPVLVIVTIMWSLLTLDYCFLEHTFVNSFEVKHLPFGFGQLFSYLVAMPFFSTFASGYAFANPELGVVLRRGSGSPELVYLLYAVSFTVFSVGYYLYRASNWQKHSFGDKSIYGPITSVVGHDSNRLLCGGLWGVVRHPNYLGDLMMAYAQAIPAGFLSPIPWIPPLLLTVMLVHRLNRSEEASADKHRSLWLHYTRLVPYKLIPKIY